MELQIEATYFSDQLEFRNWLELNHMNIKELYVGFYKVKSGKPSMTWSESVDQALCFGWIDGIRRSVDHERYMIRFTPRKPKSNWSAINIKKVENLTKLGLMKEEGLAIFKMRKAENPKQIYSYKKERIELRNKYENQFKENKNAWEFFQSLPPSYRKPAINWVISAKQENTRIRRLEQLIKDSNAGRKIKALNNEYKKQFEG